jgi:hypothetical protein
MSRTAIEEHGMTMKRRVAPMLRRVLPRSAYSFLRDVSSGRLRNRLSHRVKVESFSPKDAWLAGAIAAVDVRKKTDLCRIMTAHGSDKGSGWHNYTTIYNVIFEGFRDQSGRIFELGLGTNNTSLVSNMGMEGRPGASLRGWREFFPRFRAFGADIDRDILFQEDRIDTVYCDQRSPEAIRRMWQDERLREPFNIIVEDALHTFEANTCFLEHSIRHVAPGGFFVVEDIHLNDMDAWRTLLSSDYRRNYPEMAFFLLQIPNPQNPDFNNMVLAHRSA